MTSSSARLSRLLGFLEFDPGNLTLRLDTIREAFGAGDCDAARKLVYDGLARHPREPELEGLLSYSHACTLFTQRRYADALEYVSDTSLQLDPSLGVTLRARCLRHLCRPAEAIADLDAYLCISPHDAEANGLLALLLYEQGLSGRADAYVSVALECDPRQAEALLTLGFLQADALPVVYH